LKCRNPICERDMIGPVGVKVTGAHLPDISVVNAKYWKFAIDKQHELEWIGYVCPSCGYSRIIKHYVDIETGMVALD